MTNEVYFDPKKWPKWMRDILKEGGIYPDAINSLRWMIGINYDVIEADDWIINNRSELKYSRLTSDEFFKLYERV